MATTDAFREVFELGVVLRRGNDPERCREALELLRRFATDLALDRQTHQLAVALLGEFGPRYRDG